MNIPKVIKPIFYFSYVLIGSAIIGIFMFFNLRADPEFDNFFSIFVLVLTLWNLITGLGILSKQKWGFWLFKIYLYVLYAGIPIGTVISKKFFAYIKDKNIERYYE